MGISLKQYWNMIVDYLRPQWQRVTWLTALLLGSIGLQLVNPQILREFVDTASSGGTQGQLLLIALVFIAVALGNQGLAVGAAYLSENVGWTATNHLRNDLTLHCLRLDMSFHKARTPGELIERIDGDVTAMANFFSQFVIYILGNLLLLVGVLIVLFWEDWRIGLSLTFFSVLVLGAILRTRTLAVPHWTAARQSSADLFGFLEERLAGTEDIRSSGANSYMMRRLYEWMRELYLKERKAWIMGGMTWLIPTSLFTLAFVVMFVLSFWLYNAGAMTLGTVFLVYNYTGLMLRPLNMIINQMEDLQRASAGMTRVQELFDTTNDIKDEGRTPLPPGPLSVEYDQIDFGYEADDLVLQDITFDLQPGKVLGVLGRTGSGKTTLTRLLQRLYEPVGGAIRLSGVPIDQTSLHNLRRRVGMVTQDVQLFNATVRDNLSLFDTSISDERILAALDDLGLLPWLDALPNGLDTELASGGGLSAGEAQILAFTRVFLHDPGLVILDEASSRLDPLTEHLLERAVDKLLRPSQGRRTAIIIAHRLQTVGRADEILILEAGRIVEWGPRELLAANPRSRFHHLLQVGMEEVLA